MPENRRSRISLKKDQRKAAIALMLSIAAAAIALIVVVVVIAVSYTVIENRRSTELAVCAVADYAAQQAKAFRDNPPAPGVPPAEAQRRRDATVALSRLSTDMRATGIHCPPPGRKE